MIRKDFVSNSSSSSFILSIKTEDIIKLSKKYKFIPSKYKKFKKFTDERIKFLKECNEPYDESIINSDMTYCKMQTLPDVYENVELTLKDIEECLQRCPCCDYYGYDENYHSVKKDYKECPWYQMLLDAKKKIELGYRIFKVEIGDDCIYGGYDLKKYWNDEYFMRFGMDNDVVIGSVNNH